MSADLPTARLIAHMLCPTREMGAIAVPAPDRHLDLLKACYRNKIPLLSLDTQMPDLASLYRGELFQRAWAEEHERWQLLRQEYLLVHEALEHAGIRDVLIKSTGIAPSLPYKSDNMDTLVALENGPRARGILLDLGYIELLNVEEPHKFLFRKFHLGSTVSAIHLHEFVGWGTGFMEDQSVLDNARGSPDDPAAWIPSPEDGFLVTIAHAFYEDKEIKLGDLWKAIHILREHNLDWDGLYRQVSRRGWREGLDTCIWLWAELERVLYGGHSFPENVVQDAREQAPDYCREYLEKRFSKTPTFPLDISFRFSKRHYYRKICHDETLPLRQKAVDMALHSLAGVKRRLPLKLQRRMLVTLSGIDGSGKTTQANALLQAFQECDIEVEYVWSRGASSKLTDSVIRLIKPFLSRRGDMDVVSDTRQAKVKRKNAWLRRPLLRWGWISLLVLDLLFHYWLKVSWPLLRGRVVIADRYTYDALVELAALLDRMQATQSWAARLLMFLCPRPHLAYLLEMPPKQAQSRVPDELVEFLERQAFIYQKMALPWRLRRVDATDGLAKISDRLTHKVLSGYYRRWHRFTERRM